MQIEFYKYQGTGNDFVIIDNRDGNFDSKNIDLVSYLCNRRMGIGADGLMLLEKHKAEEVAFTMRYYNSDGKEASMCGNGGRCIAAFAVKVGAADPSKPFYFEAVDGMHIAKYNNGIVSLQMTDVKTIDINDGYYFLDTGSPHYVAHKSNIDTLDIVKIGRQIRHSDTFKPAGTNVNIVEEIAPDHIKVRTYERGVEDETYSCGTGVVASAISTFTKNNECRDFNIDVKGGRLQVWFEGDTAGGFKNIWLTGPATFVYKGNITV
ncbi:diaminopimelate epimerase [Saccharicrinis fermentans]|uniref:Diaminopimelate epimerase n=1 Tax=Saccharicrinis fermentans DSM 9555 = JCM 21142 TaxID=869213 RepID=W7Y459_9BACT|nr:diaminopimelate epimerase [Saccharicrinis fermentans]GAF05650.1 diaminopimelate epimerase [Saccharicrinis fermentans DSM 9555 = JCM 21142]